MDPHHEYDTGSAEADNLQNTDQTDLIASTNSSSEAHLSTARFPEQALALMAVSASSLSGVGEGGPGDSRHFETYNGEGPR
jgi:hypothetical protein